MTTAHFCGFLRILISPLSLVLLSDWGGRYIFVTAVVVIGAMTDILDGYFARKFGTVSDFGVFLDLTADKIFMALLLLAMVLVELVPVWVVAIIFFREFLVMGLRSYAGSLNLVVSARMLGSLKTIVLFVAALAALQSVEYSYHLFAVAAGLSIVSGAQYIWQVWSERCTRKE